MPKKHRDATTGQYTTAADAAARPAETVAEAVPARHETPDLAELRRLAENATPGPWTFEAPQRFEVPIERELCCCSGVGDEYELVSETADGHVHLWHESHIIYAGENVVAGNYDYEDGGILERRDRDYIAAASPDVVLGLLDRLAHMTEARDNARAEVKRLTALVEAVREYVAARQANIDHGPLLSARKAAHDALLAALARLDEEPQP